MQCLNCHGLKPIVVTTKTAIFYLWTSAFISITFLLNVLVVKSCFMCVSGVNLKKMFLQLNHLQFFTIIHVYLTIYSNLQLYMSCFFFYGSTFYDCIKMGAWYRSTSIAGSWTESNQNCIVADFVIAKYWIVV